MRNMNTLTIHRKQAFKLISLINESMVQYFGDLLANVKKKHMIQFIKNIPLLAKTNTDAIWSNIVWRHDYYKIGN